MHGGPFAPEIWKQPMSAQDRKRSVQSTPFLLEVWSSWRQEASTALYHLFPGAGRNSYTGTRFPENWKQCIPQQATRSSPPFNAPSAESSHWANSTMEMQRGGDHTRMPASQGGHTHSKDRPAEHESSDQRISTRCGERISAVRVQGGAVPVCLL